MRLILDKGLIIIIVSYLDQGAPVDNTLPLFWSANRR